MYGSINYQRISFRKFFPGLHLRLCQGKIRKTLSCVKFLLGTELCHCFFIIIIWHNSPQWDMAFSFTRFLDHTQRRTTVGRTPLDAWSALRRDLYLTIHNKTARHSCPGGIRTHNLSRRATAESKIFWAFNGRFTALVFSYFLHKTAVPLTF